MNLLVMFAKNPDTEPVKTRLAKDIGKNAARRIYVGMMTQLVYEHRGREEYDLKLYISGDTAWFDDFRVPTFHQVGDTLGDRMLDCFRNELGVYDRVIIIGTDCPDVTHEWVKDAFTFSGDGVIGPSKDGGYYLIGMKSDHEIFSGVEWGSDSVYASTMNKINKLSLDFKEMGVKTDIDTAEDLKQFEE